MTSKRKSVRSTAILVLMMDGLRGTGAFSRQERNLNFECKKASRNLVVRPVENGDRINVR
jgi:hypothetical protein